MSGAMSAHLDVTVCGPQRRLYVAPLQVIIENSHCHSGASRALASQC
jgi:hypothetical protein